MSRGVVGIAAPLIGRREQAPWWATHPVLPKPAAASTNITMTADASTAHTPGAWVEAVASTAFETAALSVSVGGLSGATVAGSMIDIGVGAAASEVVVVANVPVGHASYVQDIHGLSFVVPIRIPKGSRIAGRLQSSALSKTGNMTIEPVRLPDGAPPVRNTTVDTIGAVTASSSGTDFHATADTWTELLSATARAYSGVVLVPGYNTTGAANRWNYSELGVGASGGEQVVAAMNWYSSTTELCYSLVPGVTGLHGVNIPKGTRLAIRNNYANASTYQMSVLGVPY